MATTQERDLRRVGASGPGVYRCVVVADVLLVCWLAGLSAGLVPAPGDEPGPTAAGLTVPGRVAAGLAAVLWSAVTVSFHRNYLHVPAPDPARVTVEVVDGERAVVLVGRSTYRWQPVFAAAVVAGLAVLLAWVLGAAGTPGWWIALVVVSPVLLGLPSRVAALRHPLRLVLSPRGIGVTGPDGDGRLDWGDVRDVQLLHDSQWAVVRVVGAERAASWRHRARRRVLVVGRRAPGPARLDVPTPAFPVEVGPVLAAVEHYRREPGARAELGGAAGRARVLGAGG